MILRTVPGPNGSQLCTFQIEPFGTVEQGDTGATPGGNIVTGVVGATYIEGVTLVDTEGNPEDIGTLLREMVVVQHHMLACLKIIAMAVQRRRDENVDAIVESMVASMQPLAG